ncbi:MAG: hypothetical protein IRZ16_17260 [Myxococcaceae bacterium]|nr:hypothetical protein [Myxococcaceae bacterium]
MSTSHRTGRTIVLMALLGAIPLTALALSPPQSFVMSEDESTRLTLEEAGILNPDGRRWAIALGKALFWDQQAGSDGNACASCHFSAGADARIENTLSPGLQDLTFGPDGDLSFGSQRSDTHEVWPGYMPSGARAGPNYRLVPADLPMHQLADEHDRNSPVRTTTNDRISSQGSFAAQLIRIGTQGQPDRCLVALNSPFKAAQRLVRQVEPRQTPTTINSAFFHRNFWDGRANNHFNGVGPFGMRDILGNPNARLIVLEGGQLRLDYLRVENASLASQAVAPPLSALEMSCEGRSFPELGRKLLGTIPLALQQVSTGDSVLGGMANPWGRGLWPTYRYEYLIQRAFNPKYWQANGHYTIVDGRLQADPDGYRQIEMNFSMFWGLAIMLYEQTLIADQSPFDAQGVTTPESCYTVPLGVTDPLWARGCEIFFSSAGNGPVGNGTGGNCSVCHGGTVPNSGTPARQAVLAESAFQAGQTFPLMIQVPKSLGGVHRHDNGFMSIGLRPVFTDLLTGGTDPYGYPLSYARQYQNYLQYGTPVVDLALERAVRTGQGLFGFVVPGTPGAGQPAPVLGMDGAAKSPILRNVALTPPYFSWGGYPSLRQAMKFYNRGGNRRDITPANAERERAPGTACTSGDNTGTGPDGNQPYERMSTVTDCDTNTTGAILPLNLLDCDPDPATGQLPAACVAAGKDAHTDDLAALVRFLQSLTDPRVQCDVAPFDHPELQVVLGQDTRDRNGDGKLDDRLFTLPAVGASGYSPASGFCIPNAGDLFAPGMQARAGGARVPLR